MKTYGYADGQPLNEHGLLRMREVSFVANPEIVREIAAFFLHAASEMERLGDRYDHIHLQDNSAAWSEDWADIVICKAKQS